jgi:uncharacterized protein with HEPN domain
MTGECDDLVDYEVVFDTVRDDLPPLIGHLKQLLR